MLNLIKDIFAEPGQGFYGCYNGWAFGEDKDRQEVMNFSCNYSTLMVFLGLDWCFFCFFFLIKLALETCPVGCFDFNLVHGLHKGFHFFFNVTDKL